MAGKSLNSFGSKDWSPGPPVTRYNVSGKNREFYTFENAPGIGAYATGGTIIDGGDGYIYHIFTGSGTFTVNRPPAAIDSVDYLIVAGGGAGSTTPAPTGPRNGGGGGGGFRSGNILVSTGSYPIVVGAGGPSAPSFGPSRSGSSSSAFGLTATGGGSGTVYSYPATTIPVSGGSGGGGADTSGGPVLGPTAGQQPGGLGDNPPTIPRQGYPGGNGAPWTSPTGASAGGGGAGGVGSNWVSGTSGTLGGPGRIEPNFPPTIVSRAIPAPDLPTWQPLIVPGGYSAGGPGNPSPSPRTTPANSGYGGNPGGSSGGSGIVCIRYKKTAAYSRATGGTIEPNTHPEHPGVWRHIFTSPGDFTITDPTLQWIDYLAVGGGGAGGNINPATAGAGGGGGGGGFVSSIHTSTTTPTSIPEAYPWNPGYSVRVGERMPVGVGTYPIGIGTGGVTTNSPRNGSPTTIGYPGPSQIIAAGGGGGASVPGTGGSGGSGGGSSTIGPAIPGGAASPSPSIQGNSGGNGTVSPSIRNAGGGGGAGGVGLNGPGSGAAPYPGVAGGPGWYSVLSPSAYGTPGPLTPTAQYRYFAGGGGSGGTYWVGGTTSPSPGGAGGVGGGGTGGAPPSSPGTSAATPGTTNTGGGGGGAGSAGGDGGPGIVIIQYPE
jgi:hypothetical protein